MKKPNTKRTTLSQLQRDNLSNVTGGTQPLADFRARFITLGGLQPVTPTQPATTDGLGSFGTLG